MTDKKKVRGISINNSYKVVLHTEGHTVISDEPLEEGGSDEGMNPFELLCGSIASCTAITIQMYLKRKGWKIDDLTVDVELRNHQENNIVKNVFHRRLLIKSSLTDEQLERVKAIASACPISRIVEAGNNSSITSLEKR